MSRLFASLRPLLRLVQRLLAAQPSNVYEEIAFTALRRMAAQFGQERVLHA